MDPELQARVTNALREAARTARDSTTQAEAAELVGILTQPVPDTTPPSPVPEPAVVVTPDTGSTP